MALYAFDGTWNEAKTSEDLDYRNTNVVRFRDAYKKKTGTKHVLRRRGRDPDDFVGRALGGVFGLGELPASRRRTHTCARPGPPATR